MGVFFESSLSILTSIGIFNFLIGLLVIAITRLSPVTIVPLVISAATAIADGVGWYAYYAPHSKTQTAISASVADIFWLIQEAGLPLYSYQLVIRLLREERERKAFIWGFWALIASSTVLRLLIVAEEVQDIMQESSNGAIAINRLHTGYFVSIALVEILSSSFLLREFVTGDANSKQLDLGVGLFRYMLRSTELRLAALALIGITRAFTYPFQDMTGDSADVPGQIYHFATTMQCLFPVVIYIDILAARIHVHPTHRRPSSSSNWPFNNFNTDSNSNYSTHPFADIQTISEKERIV